MYQQIKEANYFFANNSNTNKNQLKQFKFIIVNGLSTVLRLKNADELQEKTYLNSKK